MLATASGHGEAARLLGDAAPPPAGDLPTLRSIELVPAVRRSDLESVRALLDSGVPADAKTPNLSKHHYLLRCEATDDFFDASEVKGEGSFGDADHPVLGLALEQGHDAIVAALIAAGAGGEEGTDPGHPANSSLIDAARLGRGAAASALIAAGADVDARDVEGKTPLLAAARAGMRRSSAS